MPFERGRKLALRTRGRVMRPPCDAGTVPSPGIWRPLLLILLLPAPLPLLSTLTLQSNRSPHSPLLNLPSNRVPETGSTSLKSPPPISRVAPSLASIPLWRFPAMPLCGPFFHRKGQPSLPDGRRIPASSVQSMTHPPPTRAPALSLIPFPGIWLRLFAPLLRPQNARTSAIMPRRSRIISLPIPPNLDSRTYHPLGDFCLNF